MNKDLIYLFGMPGSGKTTLGKQLAESLGKIFVDLDHEIELLESRSIPQIFADEGEEYFRKVESEVVKKSIELEDAVISTGGGAPCFFDNLQVMNRAGLSVYIKVSSEELVRRTFVPDAIDSRPLLAGKDKETVLLETKERLSQRTQFYESANLKVTGDNLSLDDLVLALSQFQ